MLRYGKFVILHYFLVGKTARLYLNWYVTDLALV